MRAHFDATFYLARYTDIAGTEIDPLEHYIHRGWREGRDPSPDFSTHYYLSVNPDVREAGINPFWHYIVFGRAEGRPGKPPESADLPEAEQETRIAEELRDVAAHFDATFYLARYTDIAGAEIDPLEHYMRQGWREGRDPSPDFSTRYYLSVNPDVREAEINPFWHYIVFGRAEGRPGKPPESADLPEAEQ